MTEQKTVSKEQAAISASQKTLSATAGAWILQKEDYAIGHQWKAEGKPIVWSCALVPEDVYYAMDVMPFFPEQFSALFSVRRLGGSRDPSVPTYATKFCQTAEAEGYRDYICGYARTVLGYVIECLKGTHDWTDVPLGGPPLPDCMVTSSLACDVRMKWFEALAHMLKVPLYVLDIPELADDLAQARIDRRHRVYLYRHEVERGDEPDFVVSAPKDYDLDYAKASYEGFIEFLEQVSRNKYDPDKLNEHLEWSYKCNQLNLEINELRKAVPAVMPATDGFAFAYPRLYSMCHERAYNLFKTARDEIREMVKEGRSAIPDEKFRLIWDGIPTWFNMGILNYFEKYGGVFVWEGTYNVRQVPPRCPDDPIRELALRHLGSMGTGGQISALIHDVNEYNIDGVVFSYLITCRPMVLARAETARYLEREMQIPVVRLESDLVDERIFAQSQAFTRLDAFAEQLLAKGPRERRKLPTM